MASADVALLATRLDFTSEKAPFDGVITERLAEAGDAIPAYTHILTMSDPESLAIILPVSELIINDDGSVSVQCMFVVLLCR